VDGTTLLHFAAYFDELEIAEWSLDQGMDPDTPSAIDADGFGGSAALYSSVVSRRGFWVNNGKGHPDEARFTHLLRNRGANPNVRASLRVRWWTGARVSKRDTLRLGRTVPRARMILSNICLHHRLHTAVTVRTPRDRERVTLLARRDYVEVRRTFSARGPLGPSPTSNSTLSPSRKSAIPSP
jgi:hypothetical protein